MLDFTNYKSILCLDGDLPRVSFFNNNLPIIAADGAANQLMALGIKPELVIGDLDSIRPEHLEQLATFYHYDQNLCDFEKSLRYLHQKDLLPTIIVGLNGGFLDHVLNNINHFMDTNNVLYAPPIYGFTLVSHSAKALNLPFNSKISLLGIPSAKISTQGLKWDLNNAHLSFPGHNSCFNRSVTAEIEITVHEGAILMLIYEDTTVT
jgi:thiamine pyrophosphokinase